MDAGIAVREDLLQKKAPFRTVSATRVYKEF